MATYKYLIVGGGMTAAAAVDGIREVDPAGSIGLISAESDPPYNRPPLSKKLWKGKPLESIWRKLDGKAVDLRLGHTVAEIDLRQKRVVCDKGDVTTYEKLLLATGGTPRRLPFEDDRIIYFRTLSDYRRLREWTVTGKKFAVIGGGFIGSEIAAALAMNGKEVALIFPGEAICGRLFPRELSLFLNEYYRRKGVEVLPGEKVVGMEAQGDRRVLTTGENHEIVADGVIAGIGIQMNVELARSAGLKVEEGIVVDEFLRAGAPDVYAAGDVAEFYNPILRKRMRVEHEDNANVMGQTAGRNMAGKPEAYHHLPFFYSDLFELGYEAIGDLNPRLEIVTDWTQPHEKGVVYYLDHGRVRGVLLWNVWKQVEAARLLIAESGPFRPADLKGRLK